MEKTDQKKVLGDFFFGFQGIYFLVSNFWKLGDKKKRVFDHRVFKTKIGFEFSENCDCS